MGKLDSLRLSGNALSFRASQYITNVTYDESGNPISADAGIDQKKVDAAKKEEGKFDQESVKEGQEQPKKPWTWKTVGVTAAGSFGTILGGLLTVTSVITMSGRGSLLRFIPAAASGCHSATLGPVIVNQRLKIDKDVTLRETVDALREEANRLHMENDTMHQNIELLQMDVKRLKEVKDALVDLCNDQEMTLDELIKDIKEFEKINEEMMTCIKQRAIEEVTSIVLESDTNADFKISDSEIECLLFRLRYVETITIDEEKLKKTIKDHNGSLKIILKLLNESFEDNPHISAVSVKEVSTYFLEQRSSRQMIPE